MKLFIQLIFSVSVAGILWQIIFICRGTFAGPVRRPLAVDLIGLYVLTVMACVSACLLWWK